LNKGFLSCRPIDEFICYNRVVKKFLKKLTMFILLIIALIVFYFLILHIFVKPSNNRDWADDQKILPYADINLNLISIHNIRNFTYASTTSYTANYYDKTFDLNKIKNVYYIVEPFSGTVGAAHTFLSFEFEPLSATSTSNDFVAISVEIRKEKGESFSALKGLQRKYEIMYVIADERDVVKLRSNYRKDLVYVYPIKTTKEKLQNLFVDMASRANTLKDHPEFYNSLVNTCTTNIATHVNKISPNKIPFSFKVLLPTYSDELAYKLGLIDTNLSFTETRDKYLINKKAEMYANDPDFSTKIRQ
jgi:hypothetical protein